MADPATSCDQSGNERDVTLLSASHLHDLTDTRTERIKGVDEQGPQQELIGVGVDH